VEFGILYIPDVRVMPSGSCEFRDMGTVRAKCGVANILCICLQTCVELTTADAHRPLLNYCEFRNSRSNERPSVVTDVNECVYASSKFVVRF
jgi:hypothetical protein